MRTDSIKTKLTMLIVSISAIVLLLTCTCFILVELYTFRKAHEENIRSLASIVAANSTAAVAFENAGDANETLSSLRTREDVVAAAIYTANGQVLARYPHSPDIKLPERPGFDGSSFESSFLVYFQPIVQGSTRLGTLYLKSNLSLMYERIRFYVLIAGGILLGFLFVSYVLAAVLQKRITKPILELANTAIHVSQENDYSVRAKKFTSDELGQLTDTFNQMLEQIDKMNRQLEERVRDRTAKLEDANRELIRSNAELEQFAYVSSHDLQEPLRMVSGFTSLLAEQYKGKLDAEADEYIELIIDGAKRMHALVNDLLEYSRVGKTSGHFSKVDMDNVLEMVLRTLKPSIDKCAAEVSFVKLPRIVAEPFQMNQLMQNLIGNALKFKRGDPPKVLIRAEERPDEWLFSVNDNGIGIKKEYSERIFLIFQRLHDRRQYAGTGIGLAICKKIVEHHEGKIWVDSEPGVGSTFYFTISKHLIETGRAAT